MCRRDYPSDISDEEWSSLEPLIPPAKPGGRPRTTNMREVLNALFYLDRDIWPMACPAARLSPLVYRLELLPKISR